MIIIILGAPGAGKGTTGDAMTKEFNIPKISTGDMLRKEVKDGTEIGKKAESIMKSGGLVSDDIINNILKNRIQQADCKNGFMLDGYPRTLNQAVELDKTIKELSLKLDAVINLQVSEALILKRLTSRRVCKSCGAIFNIFSQPSAKGEKICDKCGGELYQRADDNEVTIKNRLAVYMRDTSPLIEFYQKKGLLSDVVAEKGISEIMTSLKKLLKDKKLI